MTHTFTKDAQGWYISSIPEPHPFSRGALAMVAGADTFLDILAQGEDKVTLNLSTEYQNEGWEKLERTTIHDLGINGADYIIRNYMNIPYNHEMWLCPVTLWVFGGKYPKTIFFQVL
jgi:hypothetical protein